MGFRANIPSTTNQSAIPQNSSDSSVESSTSKNEICDICGLTLTKRGMTKHKNSKHKTTEYKFN